MKNKILNLNIIIDDEGIPYMDFHSTNKANARDLAVLLSVLKTMELKIIKKIDLNLTFKNTGVVNP